MRLPSHPGLVLARTVAAAALAVIPVSAALAQPPFYSAAEIRGWVVDAETKQPLEAVYVVAQWILATGLIETHHVQRLQIMETVTDARGEYYFPAWGPKPRPFLSELDTWDPQITFFLPGYRLLGRGNRVPHHDPLRTFAWNGKTLQMEHRQSSTEEWARLLRSLQMILAWGERVDDVTVRINDYWTLMPRIVLAIWEQRQLLPEKFRHQVKDLESWQVTEGQLRTILVQ